MGIEPRHDYHYVDHTIGYSYQLPSKTGHNRVTDAPFRLDGRRVIKRGSRKNSFRQLQIYWLQGLRRVRTG